jgi:pimeloyl-ACP methyl ester carboxylesterase
MYFMLNKIEAFRLFPGLGTFALLLSFSCNTMSKKMQSKELQELTLLEWQIQFAKKIPQISDFDRWGPFDFDIHENFDVRLSEKAKISSTLINPKNYRESQLVIFQHGNKSSQDDHIEQAKVIASWGFQVIILSQPNQKHWNLNSQNLKNLIQLVKAFPPIVGRIDQDFSLYLVGHSFGGYAATYASIKGADVDGIVLLDPAIYDSKIITKKRVNSKPTIIIGADEQIFRSKKREAFRSLSPRSIEISISQAGHYDAQWGESFLYSLEFLNHFTRYRYRRTYTATTVAALFALNQPHFAIAFTASLREAYKNQKVSKFLKSEL